MITHLITVFLAVSTPCLPPVDEFDLSSVSVESDASHVEERDELIKHLTLLSGKAPGEVGVLKFVVGKAPEGADTAPFSSNGLRLGNTVYLWGDDLITKRSATTRRGTFHAVSGFLEEMLGVRWVFPGDDGIVCTPRRTVRIPEGWRWKWTPPLAAVLIRTANVMEEMKRNNPYLPMAMRETEEETRKRIGDRMTWMRRMRHQTCERPPFGHAFTKWSDRFMTTHREYFAMEADGTRCAKRSSRHELCVSNEAVVDQIIADWKADGCPKYLNVCPNDTSRYCCCPDCLRLDQPDGAEVVSGRQVTDRYVNFWNRIAAKAIAIRPDVTLTTYAYAGYRKAPRKEKIAYPKHFIISMVPSQEDDNAAMIGSWKKAGMRRFFLRPNYLCYCGSFPRGYERYFYENFQLNLREGMVGCDYDAYARGGVTDFETYVIGRVLSNPDVSFEMIQKEFLSQFGKAKDVMARYFMRIRERGERALEKARVKRPQEQERRLDDSQLWKTVVAAHPVDELERDSAILHEALAVSGITEVERRRILKYTYIVRNAIATQRFADARNALSRDGFVETAVSLVELRTELKPLLPDAWGRVFRSFPFEVRWWRYIKPEMKTRFPEMELND